MAALTVAAFLTSVADIGGGHGFALLPGFLFTVAATLAFGPVEGRGRGLRYAYVGVLVGLGFATFVLSGASVGATLLLVVLVIQATLLLPAGAVAVVVALLPFLHTGMAFTDGLREGVGLFAVGAFAAVVTKLLMREQQARRALARAQLKVEALAVLEERNRVARDIHDGLGHALTVVQMQIKAARAVLAARPERADEMLVKAQAQAEEALRDVRRSVGALREQRPPVPLPEALRTLTEAAGLPVALDVRGDRRALPAEAEESLFRAAQEALTNVRKHADAGSATVVLDFRGPATVRLEVCDDGRGLPDTEGDGFGLVGIRERAARLGGRLDVSSAPGAGTTLLVEVPG
jgi:signal transduction histidine kinase